MLNTTDKIIKHKTGLLNLAEELGNVSKACQVMGMSRDTFYRYRSAVEDGGVEALFERTRRKPNLANRVDQATEDAVIKSATDFPAYGQARTSNELRKLGVFVSPSGVRSIWLRHDLANFKNRLDKHDFQLFLAINDIDHTKTKVKSPQTNGICERFHKSILQEFYQITFRKKLYDSIDELQADLDDWLHHYNHERTHQGKMCCGRTPIETMIEGKEIWREKFVN